MARRLGVQGLELETRGELTPQTLSTTGRREVRQIFTSQELEISALTCPLRHGLDVEENQEARIDYLRQVLSMSYDLGARLVVVQAGAIPETDDDPRADRLRDALAALARHGDRSGTRLALETGLESAERLAAFLDRFDSAGLAVCFNPANLLIAGFDPYEAARTLNRRIAYVQAQDARRVSPNRTATVPLGHGDLDWPRLLASLEESEYAGYLNVSGDGPAEAEAGVAVLRRLVG